jgi:succinate dehydrogenase flavin-adding protein (antitoxin of CptAB toxin-antitoxin module)
MCVKSNRMSERADPKTNDLTQFAETREEADAIIARFYQQHCYVLPVTEDDFKSIDQLLREKDKQGPEGSEDL